MSILQISNVLSFISFLKEPLSSRILRAPRGGKHSTTQLACWKGKKGEEATANFHRSLEREMKLSRFNDDKYPDLAPKFHLTSCREFASSLQPHHIDTEMCLVPPLSSPLYCIYQCRIPHCDSLYHISVSDCSCTESY